MRIEVTLARRKAEAELLREHEAVNRRRHARHRRRGGGAEPRAPRLVDRITRPYTMLGGDAHAFAEMFVRIEIGVAGLIVRDLVEAGKHRGARIDHAPFGETVSRQPLEMHITFLRAAQLARK